MTQATVGTMNHITKVKEADQIHVQVYRSFKLGLRRIILTMKLALLKIGSLIDCCAVDQTYPVTSLVPNAGLDATVQMGYQ